MNRLYSLVSLSLLLPAVIALAAGCGSPARPTPTPLPSGWTEVPFTSIERYDYGYDPNRPSDPVAYLLVSQADADRILQMLMPETKAVLEELDFGKEMALVVSLSAGAHGPYVEVRHLVYHEGTLIVYADYGDPQGYEGAAADTYPYHAVRVARNDVPGAIESVQLEVETVIVTPTPIPM